jgi:hypothetical protein
MILQKIKPGKWNVLWLEKYFRDLVIRNPPAVAPMAFSSLLRVVYINPLPFVRPSYPSSHRYFSKDMRSYTICCCDPFVEIRLEPQDVRSSLSLSHQEK